jgi:hypothetical protein
MFNVVQSALRKKKKEDPQKAEVRLVSSGETPKNEDHSHDRPPPEELKKSFEALLVCTLFLYC